MHGTREWRWKFMREKILDDINARFDEITEKLEEVLREVSDEDYSRERIWSDLNDIIKELL